MSVVNLLESTSILNRFIHLFIALHYLIVLGVCQEHSLYNIASLQVNLSVMDWNFPTCDTAIMTDFQFLYTYSFFNIFIYAYDYACLVPIIHHIRNNSQT